MTDQTKETLWHLFVSKVEGAEYENFTNCHVVVGEVDDSMDIPKLVEYTRGDTNTWWILWMSPRQIQWLPHCEVISADNNQKVPPFVACGRGLHLQGYYKGINIFSHCELSRILRAFVGLPWICAFVLQEWAHTLPDR